MPNPHKGEVELAVGEARYTLRFSIDAICRLEEATGLGLPLLAVKMSNPATMSIMLVRHALHAALFDAHPGFDLKMAGDLIVPAGGMIKVIEKITEAMAAAFPEIQAVAARPPKGPRQKKRGTGRPS